MIYFSLILGAISLFTLERFLSEKIYLGNSNIEDDLQYYNLFLYENFCHSKDQKKILNPIKISKISIPKIPLFQTDKNKFLKLSNISIIKFYIAKILLLQD